MSQQSAIFAALFLGFVVFITMRGRLPAYVALLWSRPAQQPQATGTATLGSAAAGTQTTYGPMGVPTGPVSPSGLSNVPIGGYL